MIDITLRRQASRQIGREHIGIGSAAARAGCAAHQHHVWLWLIACLQHFAVLLWNGEDNSHHHAMPLRQLMTRQDGGGGRDETEAYDEDEERMEQEHETATGTNAGAACDAPEGGDEGTACGVTKADADEGTRGCLVVGSDNEGDSGRGRRRTRRERRWIRATRTRTQGRSDERRGRREGEGRDRLQRS